MRLKVFRGTIHETLLDIDLKKVLSRIENRYKVKLPRTVVALDYGRKGDLYIRFKHSEKPIGEPEKDVLAIFFYEDSTIVAVELIDVTKFV
jgi:hypothetical protein